MGPAAELTAAGGGTARAGDNRAEGASVLETILRPAADWELASLLADATEGQRPVEIVGGHSKADYGRPRRPAAMVSMHVMRGIRRLDPVSGIVTVQAGTPVMDVERELARAGLRLAFEAADISPLYGREAGAMTIGGLIAANTAGSRRITGGSIADNIAGLRVVTGGGEVVQAGAAVRAGRNGLDWRRAIPGSFGTLAVIVEASLKVVAMPVRSATLVLLGLTPEGAIEAMGDACAGAQCVTGAAHAEAAAVRRLWHRALADGGEAATLIRVEAPSDDALEARIAAVRRMLTVYGDVHRIDDDDTVALWQDIQRMSPIAAGEQPVWRLVVLASRAAAAVSAIRRDLEVEAFFDWAGGRVWLAVPDTADAGATEIRRVMAGVGGNATLMRAPETVRASVDVFEPLDAGRELVARRLKAVFDPGGILNVGRVYR